MRGAWKEAGREGDPLIVALSYFELGEERHEDALRNLTPYYGDWGPGIAERMPGTREAARAVAEQFENLGVDQFVLFPTIPDLDQGALIRPGLSAGGPV